MTNVSSEQMQWELDETLKELAALSSDRPRYFRPPQGRFNKSLLKALRKRGLANVMWTYSLGDYGDATQATVWKNFKRAMRMFDASDRGLISCQHFCQGPGTNELIPRMAAVARSRGWEFVTLDECLGAAPMPVLRQRTAAEMQELRDLEWPRLATESIGVPWKRSKGQRGPND